jgi:hypothetical protein
MWGRVTHPTSKGAVEPSAELVFHLQGEDREVNKGVNEYTFTVTYWSQATYQLACTSIGELYKAIYVKQLIN